MPEFTNSRSLRVLDEIALPLRVVCLEAIKHIDFSLISGKRTTAEQQAMYAAGNSKLDGITGISKHQTFPGRSKSLAFDFLPVPLPDNDWNNPRLFTAYAFFFIGIGAEKGIELRSGLDWDGDFQWRDQTFMDGPHIEMV